MKTKNSVKNVIEVSENKPQSERKVIVLLALMQVFGTVVFSLALYYCFDKREALSALFGGLTAAIANLFFASRLLSHKRQLSEEVIAEKILVRFYSSEILKVVFTLIIMSVFIIVIKVSMLPFIIAYLLAAVIINWLFLLSRASSD